jgi:CHC2-type zinc finger protein
MAADAFCETKNGTDHRTEAKTMRQRRVLSLNARDLKARAHLSAFVASFVVLRRSGSQFVGLCPFHIERNSSFYVNSEKQVFYCFGCGLGGDIFAFAMRAAHCNFYQALQIVSDFVDGVASANKPRSGLWFGASEGAKPLKPPQAAAYHSQCSEESRAQILAALDSTNRRLLRIQNSNSADPEDIATACEPSRSDGAFYLKIQS